MYKGKTIAAVIPAYNEQKLISAVIKGLPGYVDAAYVVDDASTDDTNRIALELAASDGRVKVIRHAKNIGVGGGIVTGYRKCLEDNIDIAVVLAGDNQMDPSQLPKLLDEVIERGADYAVGDRTSMLRNMRGMNYWRRLGNWILRWLTRLASGNFTISDPQNGYTAITREALIRINPDSIYPWYGYCNDMLVRLVVAGARISQVSMPAVYGEEKSKIRYWRYIPKVSLLLLRDFIWRIKSQWFGKRNAVQVAK